MDRPPAYVQGKRQILCSQPWGGSEDPDWLYGSSGGQKGWFPKFCALVSMEPRLNSWPLLEINPWISRDSRGVCFFCHVHPLRSSSYCISLQCSLSWSCNRCWTVRTVKSQFLVSSNLMKAPDALQAQELRTTGKKTYSNHGFGSWSFVAIQYQQKSSDHIL